LQHTELRRSLGQPGLKVLQGKDIHWGRKKKKPTHTKKPKNTTLSKWEMEDVQGNIWISFIHLKEQNQNNMKNTSTKLVQKKYNSFIF